MEEIIRRYRYASIIKIIQHFVLQMNNPVVVDFGCGKSQISRQLNKLKIKSQAFDIDEKNVKSGIRRGVDVYYGDIAEMPLESASVDILVCSEILEHLSDEKFQKGLKEIDRVLSSRGVVIITVPSSESVRMRGGHKRYVSSSKLSAFFVDYTLLCEALVYKNAICVKNSSANLLMVFGKSMQPLFSLDDIFESGGDENE